MPVEDQLVLPPDGVAEGDEARVVGRAHLQHLFALAVLADVEGRCGDVRDQLRARQRQVGRRRPRLPDVLADRRADDDVAEREQKEIAAGSEVAVLVEDAVVRKVVLLVDATDLAVGQDEARVVEVGVEVGRADQHRDAVGRGRDPVDAAPRGAHEAGAQQQIFGRIPGYDELGKEDEIGVRGARLAEPVDDRGRVAVDVADDAIDLCECESHRFSPLGRKL